MKRILLSLMLMLPITFVFSQTAFTANNLVVYRYGNGTFKDAGTYPVNNEQVPVFLDEYTRAGVLVRSIPLPTTTVGDQRAVTGIFTATQEGALVRSVDGHYLTLMGYEAAVGVTTVNDMPRVIGRVALDGTVNTATASPHRKKGVTPVANDISTARMAVTIDGSAFWFVGTSAGAVRYMPFEYNKGLFVANMENAAQVGGASSNFGVGVFSDKLYYSTTNVVNGFSPSLPTTSAGTSVETNTFGINAFQFVMLDTDMDDQPDVMYTTQEINNTTGETKISKFVYETVPASDPVVKAWTAKGSYYNSSINVHSKHLTVAVVGEKAIIYFTSIGTTAATSAPSTAIPSAIYKIENDLDTDLDNSLTCILIATAPAKTTFRGIAFTPSIAPPLPVKLTSFTGKNTGLNSIKLNWSTISEKNNAHFEILHASKEKEFSVIGNVSGNDNSDRLINYTFTDFNPALGANYYQLKQVDFDGKSEKSNVISVENSLEKDELTCSVSQSQITLFVSFNEATMAKLQITDMSGKSVLTQTLKLNAGSNVKTFDASNLPTGVYTASLIAGKLTKSTKFFK